MSMPPLSYALLEERVGEYVKEVEDKKPSLLERGAFAFGLLCAGAGALCGVLIGGMLGLRLAQLGLAAELIGFGVSGVCMIRRERNTFRRPHVQFTRELDRDFGDYRKLVGWLRGYPARDIARRLRYIRDRKASFIYRYGLFSGGMERFGFLPVIIALYLQFKDWEFGDWQSLGKVHLLGGLLLWLLFLAYLSAWWLVGLRNRIDIYEALLAEAAITEER
ncbi:hypothetical protein [Dyella tabacisoli]|uniref:Uncharacterized protein n=1 Tax=Dyella tabacisoli TaxID=2282381 RepID=A0A369UTS6_9GAMM|nr:hypothetical protein [Dyella tabacisoli]RDD81739.1 hypothetical protein DVJ77_11325 [Dyella tabacisoli]